MRVYYPYFFFSHGIIIILDMFYNLVPIGSFVPSQASNSTKYFPFFRIQNRTIYIYIYVHKKIRRIMQIKHTMFTRNCIWIYFIRSLKPLIKADHKLFGSLTFHIRMSQQIHGNKGNKILGCVTSLDNPTSSASSSDHWYPKQMIHTAILVIDGHRYVRCCKETLSLLWLAKIEISIWWWDKVKLRGK